MTLAVQREREREMRWQQLCFPPFLPSFHHLLLLDLPPVLREELPAPAPAPPENAAAAPIAAALVPPEAMGSLL